MKAQSTTEALRTYYQTFGIANFVIAGVLFGLGFVLMLASSDPFIAHNVALILMTAGAIDLCFAAAFSAGEIPPAEKTRLRALSIMGSVLVVMAATLLASNFRVGAFEIIIMLVGLGGAPGMYWLGEFVRTKVKATATVAEAQSGKAKTATEAAKPAETGSAPTDSESNPTT